MNLEHPIEHGLLPARVLRDQDIPYTVADRMAHYNVPAASVAVIDGMEIAATGAWGHLENDQPATADPTTLFQTASISKSVTAAGALRLVRDGLLDLDSDVRAYLPAGAIPGWELPADTYPGAATLRRVLSHSAGLSVPGFEGYMAGEELPTLAQMLAGQPPANSPRVEFSAQPDTTFSYSGGGYLVLQAVMEAVTGQPFTQVMQERVFAPLGMAHSRYAPLPPAAHAQAATGHHENGEPLPGKAPIHTESAAGGLWSTPADLARLLLAIMRAYRGEDTPLLTPELAQEMLTPAFWNFGLGVRVLGEGDDLRFNHGGATLAWHGQFIAYPNRGQGITVLTNSANGYLLWPEIERGIAQALGWPGWAPESVEPLAMSDAELAAYTGTYLLEGALEVAVQPRAGGGIEIVYEGVTWPAIPTAPDTFALLELEGDITYQRDDSGALTGFDLWFGMPDWSPYRQWHFTKQQP